MDNIQDTEFLFVLLIGTVVLVVGAFLGMGIRRLLGNVGPTLQVFAQSMLGGILSLVLGIALAAAIGVAGIYTLIN